MDRLCNFDCTITLINKRLVKELLNLVLTKLELTLKWIHKTEGLHHSHLGAKL